MCQTIGSTCSPLRSAGTRHRFGLSASAGRRDGLTVTVVVPAIRTVRPRVALVMRAIGVKMLADRVLMLAFRVVMRAFTLAGAGRRRE